MDVFLQRQPNGSCLVPQVEQELCQSEPLRAQSPKELANEVAELRLRQVRLVSIRRQQVICLGQQELQNALSANGIRVGTMGYAGGFTGSLGRSYECAVTDMLRALELAASFNAKSLVVVPGSRGTHTYNHASRTIQSGLDRCLDDALRFRIDLQIALTHVIGGRNDVFVPVGCTPLEWIENLDSHRIKGMMVLRRASPWKLLPDSWTRCLKSGGILRLSRSCRQLAGTASVLSRIVQDLNTSTTTAQKSAVVSNTH